jgi:hypothetical protein
MGRNYRFSARLLPPSCIRARGNGHGSNVGGTCADVFKRNDDEAPPERRAFLRQKSQCCPLRDFDFASSDRFLKKAF